MADFVPHLRRLRTLIDPSIEELSEELTIDILSRLPVKTIIQCKLVCKKWRNLVSDSSFYNLHLSKWHPTGLVIYDHKDGRQYPGILEWVEIKNEADHHRLHHDPIRTLDLNLAPIIENAKIDRMASVNGLICLWQFSCTLKFDDTYICNPVTREIIILPRQQKYRDNLFSTVVWGFGVTSLTGEYKVVNVYKSFRSRSASLGVPLEADVYTLGTRRWRNLGQVRYPIVASTGPFLNDHFHWIVFDYVDGPERICSFDLNRETFQSFPSPPFYQGYHPNQSLAVLKGCLCKFDAYGSEFSLWVMKEYGIKESWHKEFVITYSVRDGVNWPSLEAISLKEDLKDGSILMVSYDKLWAFYPRSETMEEIERIGYSANVIAYRPSFLRLENFESENVQRF